MKKFSVVLAAVVLLGFLLAWNPGFSEAAVRVKSGAQDPAQLATASILPVKVSSKTDTIVILYRDSSDTAAATGTAGDIKLTFYGSTCVKGNDVTTNLTRGEVQFGDDAGRFAVGTAWFGSAASLFQAGGSGVILGIPVNITTTGSEPRWGMSGLVVDNDILALYERQGYPAIVKQATTLDADPPGATNSVWAGFSNANFEDFYLYGSGFKTYIQLVCPDGTLDTDMSAIAPVNGTLASTAYEIPVINVYKDDESLINSLHDKTCSCWTEDPGSISTIMTLNANVLGLFHMELASGTQDATGSRVIAVTSSAGAFTGLYVDGRIRRGTSATPATP